MLCNMKARYCMKLLPIDNKKPRECPFNIRLDMEKAGGSNAQCERMGQFNTCTLQESRNSDFL